MTLSVSAQDNSADPCPIQLSVKYKSNGEKETYNKRCDTLYKTIQYTNDSLKQEVIYLRGKPHGVCKWYWQNGNYQQISSWQQGVMVDTAYFYHENGQLQQKYFMDQGKLEGPFVEYYSNGRLRRKGQYKSGEKVGRWEKFDEEGKVIEDQNFEER
ncbi:hypothetical protein KFE98_12985 [bacterium SCSIO 12741]|nr:hypothetical protein KFE98_12985 [bacterium SCSIO 12741]